MPMYDYHCDSCGDFSALRPMSEYRDPMACPSCGETAGRVISAPNLAVMSASNRTAWERNERSAHEPRRGGCASGTCGHAHHHSKSSKADTAPAAAPLKKTATSSTTQGRPWMLGH